MSKTICITGMHRSGTSLTTSWLQACGLTVDNGHLIGAAAGNLKGHFEDKEFVDLHTKIILKENLSSRGWIESSKSYSFQASDKEGIKMLIKERQKFAQWGWKDPRTVLFLEEWVSLIPHIKFIFLWRPAYQVVNSLIERRKGSSNRDFKINKIKGYKTWRHYNNQILRFQKRYPNKCIMININKLKETDKDIYNEISQKFDCVLHYTPVESLVEENLMKARIFNIYDKLYYRIYGLAEMERELEILSFT